MKNQKQAEYVNRESILKVLSDDEVASVSTAETAVRLPDGDEFIDLEQLDLGVQRAPGKAPPMGRVLPKKSVQEKTWQKIVALLPTPSGATANGGG